MPLPWDIPGSCQSCYGPKGRHDGTGTATGGKVSPIDHWIDHDGPIGGDPISPAAHKEFARRKAQETKFGSYDPKLEREISTLRERDQREKERKDSEGDMLARKEWRVSKSSRFGGSGLFHGGRDKE